jgi:hypothetical protein
MKISKSYSTPMLVLIYVFSSSFVFGQLSMTVNSLADDEYSYAWDDPSTPEDESRDGICEDELGRCTLRAAIDESHNMSQSLDLNFSISGTINLLDVLYPEDFSIIDGSENIELTGAQSFEVNNRCTINGIKFKNLYTAIDVVGEKNVIGDHNVFLISYTALVIEGDSNTVGFNRFGIDENNVLGPNLIGISVIGNYNTITTNIICGNITGISLTEGENNEIRKNYIGTTNFGSAGYGNTQGIAIDGSGSNLIGGELLTDGNVISGNSEAGIIVGGVPPDNYSISNYVWNNIVGLDPSETYAIPNGNGVVITNGARIEFFGKNIIAGNTLDGIYIFGYNSETKTYGHTIAENRIGVNTAGLNIPNGHNGVSIWGNVEDVTTGTNVADYHLPNIIVGNQGSGIYIADQFGYYPSKITARKNLIYQNNSANLFVSRRKNRCL